MNKEKQIQLKSLKFLTDDKTLIFEHQCSTFVKWKLPLFVKLYLMVRLSCFQ